MIDPTPDSTLPRLAERLRSGALDPFEMVDRLEALLRHDQEIQSLLPEPDRLGRLRRDVQALLDRYPDPRRRPRLFAVPVAIKDIFHADGFETAAGSPIDPRRLAGPEASCVGRLRRAGVLNVGKAACTELAYFGPGPTRNPRNPEHTPGGSSSGSAAAVALGLSALALGSQTIGSIGRPAAFCGVVGFKPSFGRIPIDGVVPLAPSADHVGFFTAHVADVELAASVLVDGWRDQAVQDACFERPNLAIPEGPYLQQTSEEGRRRFQQALDRLRAAGFDVRPVPVMRGFEQLAGRHRSLVAAEAFQAHGRWLPEYGDRLHAKTVELLEAGRAVAPAELEQCRRSRTRLRHGLDRVLAESGCDLWLSPAAPGPAPKGLESTGDPVMNLPWTHAGVPALVLPDGTDRLEPHSLPTGLQLAAAFGRDEQLVAWAGTLAEALTAGSEADER